MKDYHKPGYWKDWYNNKGGREKVKASIKKRQIESLKKQYGEQFLCAYNSHKRKKEGIT